MSGLKPPAWEDRLAQGLNYADTCRSINWRHCAVGEALDLHVPLIEGEEDDHVAWVLSKYAPELEVLGLEFSRQISRENAEGARQVRAKIHAYITAHGGKEALRHVLEIAAVDRMCALQDTKEETTEEEGDTSPYKPPTPADR